MYKKVVVPIDGTLAAEQVITELRDDLGFDAEVHFLQVVRPSDTGTLDLDDRLDYDSMKSAQQYGRALLRRHAGRHPVLINAVKANRHIADAIVRYAITEAADLIAMYSKGATKGNKERPVTKRRFIGLDVKGKAPMDVVLYREADLMRREEVWLF